MADHTTSTRRVLPWPRDATVVVTHAALKPGAWYAAWRARGPGVIQPRTAHGGEGRRHRVHGEAPARSKEFGADELINYVEDQDWDRIVRGLTGKRGADVIIETVGASTWERSIRALGKHGRLVTSGATAGRIGRRPTRPQGGVVRSVAASLCTPRRDQLVGRGRGLRDMRRIGPVWLVHFSLRKRAFSVS